MQMRHGLAALVALLVTGTVASLGLDVRDVFASAGDRPPTRREQLAEQARRAAMLADVDPARWEGWEADGTAAFATPSDRLDRIRDGTPLALPDDLLEGVLVLADGRRYRQTRRAFESIVFPPDGVPASERGGEDEGGLASGLANGDVTIDAVIGADNRTTVAYGNYTQFPWRTVGTILVAQTDKAGFCTAALISPRVAVTAGHCVYSQKTKAWSWNTWFSPGHRGRGSDRFPNGNPRPVVGLLSNTAWVNNADVDHDVGFLVLADQPQTAALGYFGFMCKDTDDLEGGDIRILQYPGWQYSCAASPDPSGQCFAFQYRGQSTINDDCGNLLEHQVDTNPGSSGSPSYRFVNGDRRIFGPHAYGLSPCDSDDNKAVAMTSAKCKAACNLFANFPSQYASRSCN